MAVGGGQGGDRVGSRDAPRLQLVDLEKVDIEGGRVDQAKIHDALVLCIDDNPEVLKLMKMLLADDFGPCGGAVCTVQHSPKGILLFPENEHPIPDEREDECDGGSDDSTDAGP